MNPYAEHLGDQDPLTVLAATPAKLKAVLAARSPESVLQAPALGKWSFRHILAHLADTEMVFAFRLRQVLAEPHHVIQPFDQDLWAKTYGAYDAQAALALFTAVREWNLALLRTVPAEDLDKAVTHPERGAMTFRTIVETMAGHDINHLKQLETPASPATAV